MKPIKNKINHILKTELNGILYIVPTPIGNFSDITQRALTILTNVDMIAAENIYHTHVLLKNFKISNKLISINQKNEKKQSKKIIEKLITGKKIALVSNAGTPVINDPGFILIKNCHKNKIKVTPLPGACAAIAALSASGIASNRFCYEGFLPNKKIARCNLLQSLKKETRTIIFYESPHRILNSITDIVNEIGSNRNIVLIKEISKYWESIYHGTSSELLTWLQKDKKNCKGEMVIIIEGFQKLSGKKMLTQQICHTLNLIRKEISLKKTIELTAKIYNIKKNILYNYALNHFKE
ncbi:16S rRNA (cytidine(1402)-2'-O)-methyltransferase [Buchnera aphidicola]|uniref:16S rRNA (cytidine(1402)-2'-O)-methyltransferase n=1 Tax=Buchnera aphidicola TaxID=9 RepID=UPI0034642F1E